MNKFFGIMAAFLQACLPRAAQTQLPVRVNCGGASYTDSNGQVWKADTGFNTGTGSSNTAVTTGTSDPVLYQSNRFSQTATPLIYSFPVANGNYRVNLLFAENSGGQQAVGARVFNVKINSATVLQNFDIFAAAGANAALVEGFNATVTNGTMAIDFDKLVQNPKINAIEILPIASGPQFTMKFTYPDGTAVSGSLHYAISTSLLTLGGSVALVNGQATCALVSSPNVLGLTGQTQVFMNLTDGTGLAGLDGIQSSERGSVLGAELHAQCRFDQTLGFSEMFSQSRSEVAAALGAATFVFYEPPSVACVRLVRSRCSGV